MCNKTELICKNVVIFREISEWQTPSAQLRNPTYLRYNREKHLLLRETPAPRLWFKSKGSAEKSRWVSRKDDSAHKQRENDKQISVSTFDCNAFAGPLLLKGGEAFLLADADDVLFEVKFFSVKTQESQPQLSHWLGVGLELRETPALCWTERTQYKLKYCHKLKGNCETF